MAGRKRESGQGITIGKKRHEEAAPKAPSLATMADRGGGHIPRSKAPPKKGLIGGMAGPPPPRRRRADGKEEEHPPSTNLARGSRRNPHGKKPYAGKKPKSTPSIYRGASGVGPQPLTTSSAGEIGVGPTRGGRRRFWEL